MALADKRARGYEAVTSPFYFVRRAARYMIAKAACFHCQPAASALSSNSSKNGSIASRHSISYLRSFAGRTG